MGSSQNTTGVYVSHIPNHQGVTVGRTKHYSDSHSKFVLIGRVFLFAKVLVIHYLMEVHKIHPVFMCSHIPNAAGCDSTITTTLTVIPNSSSSASVSICQGTLHTLPDESFAKYIWGLCFRIFLMLLDVIVPSPTTLTVIPNSSSSASVFYLPGFIAYLTRWMFSKYNTSSDASHIPNSAGCDSVITATTLTVKANTSSSASVSICQGPSHTLPT